MSTQTYTANPETTNQHVTSPSGRRRWILAAASATFAALAIRAVLVFGLVQT